MTILRSDIVVQGGLQVGSIQGLPLIWEIAFRERLYGRVGGQEISMVDETVVGSVH